VTLREHCDTLTHGHFRTLALLPEPVSPLYSEGCALYLWQIRQFPNKRQNSPIWNSRPSLRILFLLCVITQPLSASAQEKSTEPTADVEQTSSAQETFNQALAALSTRKSIEATLVEQISISDQPLRMTGRYLEQAGKSRLELSVKLAVNAQGSLLEVVDGDILWNQTVIGETRQVTLRNLKQIADALAELPEPAATGGLELGLGGLSGLMGSLARSMDFEQRREEADGEDHLIVLQGKWKPEFLATWKNPESKELPAFVPDVLRVYLDAETLFPKRFLYLKRIPEKDSLRPFVRLEFQNVKLDVEIEEEAFQFTPPEDLVPDDVTTLYLDQLKRRAGIKPEDAAQPAAPAKSP